MKGDYGKIKLDINCYNKTTLQELVYDIANVDLDRLKKSMTSH